MMAHTTAKVGNGANAARRVLLLLLLASLLTGCYRTRIDPASPETLAAARRKGVELFVMNPNAVMPEIYRHTLTVRIATSESTETRWDAASREYVRDTWAQPVGVVPVGLIFALGAMFLYVSMALRTQPWQARAITGGVFVAAALPGIVVMKLLAGPFLTGDSFLPWHFAAFLFVLVEMVILIAWDPRHNWVIREEIDG